MPSIAITLGDPKSIGPEVAARALFDFFKNSRRRNVRIEIFSPEWAFKNKDLKKLKKYFLSGQARLADFSSSSQLSSLKNPSRPGKASGAIALECLKRATDSCIQGKNAALVTGPVDKKLCSLSRKNFRGHTEYLEKRSKARGTTMLLSGPDLQVALVTTHLPIAKVSRALSEKKIVETGRRLFEHVRAFKLKPRIAVCGLNPHASDNGLIGNEESRIIIPAIKKLQKLFGSGFEGPFPADSLFHQAEKYDAIICMYHDQGLIPLKMKNFYDAVNVTLGLAFLRTSVDHGTAFDLVGTGRASHTSYLRALEYAYDWIQLKHSNPRRQRT